ncbi:MAG TPA: phosphoribosylanthranilate isomerase [Tepidisphaeraceae bacterium]|jgi:phosphoribosylanthranilate isomerase
MPRTRIKFCGITRPADAAAAAEIGADAIGIVLYSNSTRRVERDLARQIIGVLPPFVTPVGLFVDAPVELVTELSSELGLRTVQLQGHEPAAYVEKLRGLAVIKAIRIGQDKPATYSGVGNLRGLLLETPNTGQPGGTGIENDWNAIRAAQDAGEFANLPPLIAAGGLRPDSVGGVVKLLRPWAVDVASGIESSRGVKSRDKMQAFVDAVRAAETSS